MPERREPNKQKLTERTVKRLKAPKSGRLEVWDQTLPAFGIQLRHTGKRRWIIAVRRPGKSSTSRLVVGDAAKMSLAEARERARQLMQDPGELKAEEESKQLSAESPIEHVIAAYIERRQKPRNRSWRCAQQILEHDLWRWSGRALGSIGSRDVRDLLGQVLARGKPRAANLLLAHLKALLNWCVEQEVIATSPAAGIKPPSPKSERERVLSDSELYEIWHRCEPLGWPFGPLVRLLMLTAQREGEVAAMRWSDLDLTAGTWSLSAAQTKAKRAHLVPLPGEAIAILKALPRFEGCDLVFPASRTGNARPVCGFSKVKVRLDRISGVTGWVFHDLRRTAATYLAKLGVAPHVTEKILNHAGNQTRGQMGKIYQRYEYLAERKAALEQWSDTLATIANPNKVVPLRR